MRVFDALPAGRPPVYPSSLRAWLSLEAAALAMREIASWPGYAPTPLVDLSGLAREAGVSRLVYKDEGGRFGLGSFKALGGAYAVSRVEAARPGEELVFCCATDGNHGRAVAWKAAALGRRCVIYLHRDVSVGRERAIRAYGAEIRRVDGNYDSSVRQAAADAAANGWILVSDTSHGGYRRIPCDVMQGYSLIAQEVLDQGLHPTHLFVQGGVGGLAAALCAHFWEVLGPEAPRVVVVEPERAACLYESAVAGRPVAIGGSLDTVMAGLACGEVSEVAWDILSQGAHHFITIADDDAMAAMRLLAAGAAGGPPLVAGESAPAGLAAFLACAADPALRRRLQIGADARILCIGTEADTDPVLYAQIVGGTASEVRAGRLAGTVG